MIPCWVCVRITSRLQKALRPNRKGKTFYSFWSWEIPWIFLRTQIQSNYTIVFQWTFIVHMCWFASALPVVNTLIRRIPWTENPKKNVWIPQKLHHYNKIYTDVATDIITYIWKYSENNFINKLQVLSTTLQLNENLLKIRQSK